MVGCLYVSFVRGKTLPRTPDNGLVMPVSCRHHPSGASGAFGAYGTWSGLIVGEAEVLPLGKGSRRTIPTISGTLTGHGALSDGLTDLHRFVLVLSVVEARLSRPPAPGSYRLRLGWAVDRVQSLISCTRHKSLHIHPSQPFR
jgi:hypothetical protein